jgi:hypothetical protein
MSGLGVVRQRPSHVDSQRFQADPVPTSFYQAGQHHGRVSLGAVYRFGGSATVGRNGRTSGGDEAGNPASLCFRSPQCLSGDTRKSPCNGVTVAEYRGYNEGVKLAMTIRLQAPPRRLRFALSYPRVGLMIVPSNARPNLFGSD